jgi:hypothetical protein
MVRPTNIHANALSVLVVGAQFTSGYKKVPDPNRIYNNNVTVERVDQNIDIGEKITVNVVIN